MRFLRRYLLEPHGSLFAPCQASWASDCAGRSSNIDARYNPGLAHEIFRSTLSAHLSTVAKESQGRRWCSSSTMSEAAVTVLRIKRKATEPPLSSLG